jgi:hypothetical protein
MPVGQDGGTQARARATAHRRARRGRLLALILVILPSTVLLASTVQASASSELSLAEREARAATREAEHTARHEARQRANVEKREAAARARREHEELNHPNGSVVFACHQVIVTYKAFPDLPGNAVGQQITIDHDHSTRSHSTFTFDGASAITTIPLDGHAGRYQVDLWANWDTNGFKGHFDLYGKVTCPSTPALSIEKLQRIAGSGAAYTPSTLSGEAGQTVEYEMLVKNTGNVALTLGALADPRCDAGTIAGGPGAEPLAPGATTTFTCTHLLNTTDQVAGSYANTAGDTATPVGGGSAVGGESNTVVVELLPPPPVQPPPGNPPANTPGTPASTSNPNNAASSPSAGVLALTAGSGVNGATPKVGVLASKTTAIPSLSSPHGCVRSSFRASVKSAGVRSVSFYMDGHRLKTMAARSARKGRLTITIDPSRLSVGAHRLMAKLTMVPSSSGAKARHATRASTVLRCSSAVLTPRFTG